MTIEIISNGSKWYGQAPDSLGTLLEVLETQPLDRRFEPYGNFVSGPLKAEDFVKPSSDFALAHVGWTHFVGNFFTVSHVFNIYTNDHDVIERLTTAIRANQRRDDYLAQEAPKRL